MRQAVFLDRDGVLNEPVVRGRRPFPPPSVQELVLIENVKAALTRLKQQNFLLIVVSNQPDVRRGLSSRASVEEINRYLADELSLDDIFVCFHDDNDACECRKPRPGLLLQAAEKYGIDLQNSYMIGDRWRDVEAGAHSGCKTIWIDYGYDEQDPKHAPNAKVATLEEAVEWILADKAETAVELVSRLKIKLFADGAKLSDIRELAQNPSICGFTTNPTLMRKAGIRDYEAFARELLAAIPDRPISFEVFSDDFAEMERQALKLAGWGDNVYVKIPVTNTRGESSCPLLRRLSDQRVKLNATALMTMQQVEQVTEAMQRCAAGYVSVFAGRIADTGRDPLPLMRRAVELLAAFPRLELIWASPRELLNIFQADAIGCHVITATGDVLQKLHLVGKDLSEYSLETVRMFRDDAVAAEFSL